jgi:hypothetical protein
MVRLACDLCPRRERYRKETLIVRFGGDVLMPNVRHLFGGVPAQGCAWCGVWRVLQRSSGAD